MYVGNFAVGAIVRRSFNTTDGVGAPVTLAGGAVQVYKDGNTTQVTTGATLTTDYDSVTGLHRVTIDTSADGSFYSAGSDFEVVLSAGTVAGVSVVGTLIVGFSLDARLADVSNGAGAAMVPLSATVAGRTLDVSSDGSAAIDWGNIDNQDATVNLSVTTIKEVTSLAGGAQSNIRTALGLAAADLDTQLDGLDPGYVIPVSQIPVPESRTWKLQRKTGSLVGEESKSMQIGEAKLFALDFFRDLPTNGRLDAFSAITIKSGTPGGVTFANDLGVDKSQAKVTITGVTAGTYVLNAVVTYNASSGGGTTEADVTLIVK